MLISFCNPLTRFSRKSIKRDDEASVHARIRIFSTFSALETKVMHVC